MTLAVPQAGNVPGRAAQGLQAPGSALAPAATQLADTMAQVGTLLENERLSREISRAQVDLTRDLNNLSLEMQQIGDPDLLDQTFNARRDELRASYLQGRTEDGRPRVDPRNADRFNLLFDETADRHAFAVGARALAARQSQREANWLAYEQEARTTASILPDAESRDVLIAGAEDQLVDMVANGVITPAEAQARLLELRGNISNEAAIRMVSDNPQGFIDAAANGQFADMDPTTVARYTVQSQNALEANAREATRAAEQANAERTRQIGDRLSEIGDIAARDGRAIDEAFLQNPEVQAHPDFGRTMAAVQLRNEVSGLTTLPPAQIQQLLDQENARPVGYAFELERREFLAEILAEARQAYATDPIAYQQSLGMSVTPLPQFDPANPRAFEAALGQRQSAAQDLVSQGYSATPRALSEAERQSIRAAADVTQPPENRVALAGVLGRTLRGVGSDNLAAVIDDPVFVHVAGLLAFGGNPAVAERAFRGQQAIDQGNIVMPPARERLDDGFQVLATVFADVPGGEVEQARIAATADAIYAANVRRSDPAGEIDSARYMQSVHEALGGTGAYGTGAELGGIQTVRGQHTVLPPGVNGRAVEAALDAITRPGPSQDGLSREEYRAQRRAPGIRLLTEISVNGQPPARVNDQGFWDDLGRVHLRALSATEYTMGYVDTSGVFRSFATADGQQYRFNLPSLLSAVQP